MITIIRYHNCSRVTLTLILLLLTLCFLLDLLSNILFELIRCPDVGISEHVGAKDDNKCLLDIISNQDCRKAGGLSWLSGFFSGSEVSQRKTLDDIVNFLDSSVEVWPVASAVAQGSQMFNLILERYNYSKTVVCILLCLTLDAQVPTVLVDAVRTTYLPKVRPCITLF